MTPEDKKQAVKESIETLVNNLNAMGGSKEIEKVIAETLGKQHRTLQQNFFRHVVKPLIAMYAEQHENGNYDARNNASCECARACMDTIDQYSFPII